MQKNEKMRALPPENDHNNNDRRPHNHLLSALRDNGLGGMREAKTIFELFFGFDIIFGIWIIVGIFG